MVEWFKYVYEMRFIWYVWCYVYCCEFLERVNLMFDEDICFVEDFFFNLFVFCEVEWVKMLDEGLYIYWENLNSLIEIFYKLVMDEYI